ncbi:MAG: hypothetical protein QHH15_00600 [Candidatus Thermoplasmatota archaeon]|jgi:hypothetical protein|nr:hypothetical protein [Candidatus Thermoplasmatota archaeon]
MDFFSKKKVVQTPMRTASLNSSDDIHSIIDKKLSGTESPKNSSPPLYDGDHVPPGSSDFMPVKYTEKISTWNWTRVVLYLTVLGIIGIIFFTQYLVPSPTFLLLTWLFGMMCFLPLGLVLGWLFLNIEVRVLIYRKMRGKNYGIVHFVHRGGQRMVTRIKDFDNDVIIQDTKMWILKNEGIYYMDKNRNLVMHAAIHSHHIKTLPANIPVLYLDADTMIPLTFHKVESQSNPQQVGSTILGYIYNQFAKSLFMKRGLQIFFIILIILAAVNFVIGLQSAMWLDEMEKQIYSLQDKINRIVNIFSNSNISLPKPPVSIVMGWLFDS